MSEPPPSFVNVADHDAPKFEDTDVSNVAYESEMASHQLVIMRLMVALHLQV